MALNPTRRDLLKWAGAGALAWGWPGFSAASTGASTRLIVVILRGGMDGMHALPAYGEPRLASLRGPLSTGQPGGEHSSLKLDGMFALHPSMRECAALFKAGQFAAVHAAAPPYHERSHFDAQDCLENGSAAPHLLKDGWLNRAAAEVADARSLAIASSMPLLLRGGAAAETWSPSPLPEVSENLTQRLAPLYARDPRLHEPFGKAADASGVPGMTQNPQLRLPQAMQDAARFMQTARGPRLVAMQDSGWDTHAFQGSIGGMLANKLAGLDQAIVTARDNLGPLWDDTVIVIATEFGRTVKVNGSGGTDHGIGGAMFLAGGALKGGRVIADWPGLKDSDMVDGRYLRPTTDVRAVFKGLLRDHMRLGEKALDTRVFPDSRGLKAMEGLST